MDENAPNNDVSINDLPYFRGSLYGAFKHSAEQYPEIAAYKFIGNEVKYKKALEQVHHCAKALRAIGVGKGDKVSIILPNCPQAIIFFYAVSEVGAIANMIHPLSSQNEILFFLKTADSKVALTLDMFYSKIRYIIDESPLRTLIVASIKDALTGVKKFLYGIPKKNRFRVHYGAKVVKWQDFIAVGKMYNGPVDEDVKATDPAVILYSGGTTGDPKGVVHSSDAFNALAYQLVSTQNMSPGTSFLSIVPVFHGFGLGVSIHTPLSYGMTCILMPRFTPDTYALTILKNRANVLAGPPTLFDAMTRSSKLLKALDMTFLQGIFCGGDILTPDVQERFNNFLEERKSPVPISQGYGLAESIGAVCLSPNGCKKLGTIGVPLEGMEMEIYMPGTFNIAKPCEVGEICVRGPTNMLYYLDNPEATAEAKVMHPDGKVWVHTGDLGYKDQDGLFYFVQRLKRMIVSNGYNVYPSQIEKVFDSHPMVKMSCAIGLPDPRKGKKIKVVVVLNPGYMPSPDIKMELMEHARKNIAKYALPSSIDFRDSLPLTSIGKIAYRVLEDEYAYNSYDN